MRRYPSNVSESLLWDRSQRLTNFMDTPFSLRDGLALLSPPHPNPAESSGSHVSSSMTISEVSYVHFGRKIRSTVPLPLHTCRRRCTTVVKQLHAWKLTLTCTYLSSHTQINAHGTLRWDRKKSSWDCDWNKAFLTQKKSNVLLKRIFLT